MDLSLDRTRPEAVSELRRQIGGFLERHGTDAGAARVGELVVGELLAKAFEHSDGDVWVSVDWTGEHPVVAVHDLGPAFAIRSRLPEGAAEGGRGLYLVASLAGELRQAAKAAGAKTVSARLDVRRRREFGGIAARNSGGASVLLQERIAVGDQKCRVIVRLGDAGGPGHRYAEPRASGDEAEAEAAARTAGVASADLLRSPADR